MLVLSDSGHVGRAVTEGLRARGNRVTVVLAGDGFALLDDDLITVDPRDQQGCTRLLEHLRNRSLVPDTVMHLWPLEPRSDSGTSPARISADAEAVIQRDYVWFTDFLTHLAGEVGGGPIHVLAATAGLHAVHAAEPTSPLHAPLLGAARVLPRELPGMTFRMVDLDPEERDDAARWREALCAEFAEASNGSPGGEGAASPPPRVIAHRGPRRWERVFVRSPLPPEPEADGLFRPRGTYLITGGLGGLGLTLADFLSSACQANLVLLSRRSLPPRGAWEQATDPDHLDVIRRLRMLEERGSQLLVLTADVGDPVAMQAAQQRARERFGPLHGVIHAAGVADHAIAARRERAATWRVLAPKIMGTLNLMEWAAGEPSLDFLALFSSTSAQLGGVGALDYSSANNFLDAFAMSRRNTRPHVVSIGWGLWRDVGVAARWQPSGNLGDRYAAALDGGITPAEGVQAFVRVLASGWSHVTVSPHDLEALLATGYDLLADSPDASNVVARGEPPAEAPAAPSGGAPAVASDVEDDRLESAVTELWCDVLQVENLGRDDDFFDVGGHSLLLVTLVNRLHRRFGRLVPIRRLLTEPTIARCVGILRDG